MPTFRNTVQIAAGATIPNIMAGSQFEFLGRATRVRVYITADGAGIGQAEVFFGQELEMNQSQVPDAVAAGQGPIIPDNLVVDDVGAPGDRIVVRLSETGGAAVVNVRTLVDLTPLG